MGGMITYKGSKKFTVIDFLTWNLFILLKDASDTGDRGFSHSKTFLGTNQERVKCYIASRSYV